MVWYPPGFPFEFTVGHLVGPQLPTDRPAHLERRGRPARLARVRAAVPTRPPAVLGRRGHRPRGVATPIFDIYEWILSETGFVLICLAFVLALEKLLERPRHAGGCSPRSRSRGAATCSGTSGSRSSSPVRRGSSSALWRRGWRRPFIELGGLLGARAHRPDRLVDPQLRRLRDDRGTARGHRAADRVPADEDGRHAERVDLAEHHVDQQDASAATVSSSSTRCSRPLLLLVAVGGSARRVLAWRRHAKRLEPPTGASLVAVTVLPLLPLRPHLRQDPLRRGHRCEQPLPAARSSSRSSSSASCASSGLSTPTPRPVARVWRVDRRSRCCPAACAVQGFCSWRLVDQSFDFGIGYSTPDVGVRPLRAVREEPPERSTRGVERPVGDVDDRASRRSSRRSRSEAGVLRRRSSDRLACDHAYLFWVPWPTKPGARSSTRSSRRVLTQIGSFPWGQIYGWHPRRDRPTTARPEPGTGRSPDRSPAADSRRIRRSSTGRRCSGRSGSGATKPQMPPAEVRRDQRRVRDARRDPPRRRSASDRGGRTTVARGRRTTATSHAASRHRAPTASRRGPRPARSPGGPRSSATSGRRGGRKRSSWWVAETPLSNIHASVRREPLVLAVDAHESTDAHGAMPTCLELVDEQDVLGGAHSTVQSRRAPSTARGCEEVVARDGRLERRGPGSRPNVEWIQVESPSGTATPPTAPTPPSSSARQRTSQLPGSSTSASTIATRSSLARRGPARACRAPPALPGGQAAPTGGRGVGGDPLGGPVRRPVVDDDDLVVAERRRGARSRSSVSDDRVAPR